MKKNSLEILIFVVFVLCVIGTAITQSVRIEQLEEEIATFETLEERVEFQAEEIRRIEAWIDTQSDVNSAVIDFARVVQARLDDPDARR